MATPARLQCSLHPQPRAHPTAAQGRRRLGDLDRRGVGPRPAPHAAHRLGRARRGRHAPRLLRGRREPHRRRRDQVRHQHHTRVGHGVYTHLRLLRVP